MAQAGYTPIRLYYSTTASAVPDAANLAAGELALNIADMKLYCENSSGVVTLLASSSGASGDVVGPASATDNAVVRFDGTTGKLVQNSGVLIADDGTTVISVNSATDALRITQTGAGNALVVEDSANPDATPFVVDASGSVGVKTSTMTGTFNVVGNSFLGNFATAPSVNIQRAEGSASSPTVVSSGQTIGQHLFNGYDGSSYVLGASILAAVDGTPGTNDMPGRLVFSTTADGASSPTERMRIRNDGGVGIGESGSTAAQLTFGGTMLSASNTARGITIRSTAPSTATTEVTSFFSNPNTTAASFTVVTLNHYTAVQGTIGATSAITSQYGFNASSTLTGATNNFGFYSNIASGTGRWNFYANGTADNYFAGNVGIATTSPGSALDVKGTLRLSGSSSGYVGLAPAAAAGSTTYTLPSADGTSGQVLSTNGSGTLSWATAGGSTPLSSATTTTVAAAATTTINCALGSVFNITWGATITTLSFTNVPASPQATQLVLVFKKDTNVTQYSIVWPTSIAWQDNTPPSTNVNPNSVITVTLTTINGGTNWRGSFQTIEGYAGALWGWGSNTKGQLGDGTATNRSSPVQIGGLNTWIGISSFVAGANEGSFAITSDGVTNGTGTGVVFGMPPNLFSSGPFSTMVPVASGLRAYAIQGAGNAAVAIDINGKLYGWGTSASLGLGIDNSSGTSTLSAPVIINSGTWIDIAAGAENSYAVRSDGTLWATGRNAEGQLGQGNTTVRYTWVQVGTGTTWSSVACGTDSDLHVLSLRTDGTLWSFGNNGSGQLGLGNAINRSSPVQIGTDTNWVQISASGASSAAIKSNGTLWTWGLNSSGQLGLGNIVDRSSPTQVGALTDWRQVCMSTISGYAIKTNGTLWAWGNATGGALGNGVVVSTSSPVQIGAATDWLWLPKNGAGSYMHCIRGTATNP